MSASTRTHHHDIVALYVAFLDVSDLVACMRVSRVFHDCAGALLYRHLVVDLDRAVHPFRDLDSPSTSSGRPSAAPSRKCRLLRHARVLDFSQHHVSCHEPSPWPLEPMAAVEVVRLKPHHGRQRETRCATAAAICSRHDVTRELWAHVQPVTVIYQDVTQNHQLSPCGDSWYTLPASARRVVYCVPEQVPTGWPPLLPSAVDEAVVVVPTLPMWPSSHIAFNVQRLVGGPTGTSPLGDDLSPVLFNKILRDALQRPRFFRADIVRALRRRANHVVFVETGAPFFPRLNRSWRQGWIDLQNDTSWQRDDDDEDYDSRRQGTLTCWSVLEFEAHPHYRAAGRVSALAPWHDAGMNVVEVDYDRLAR